MNGAELLVSALEKEGVQQDLRIDRNHIALSTRLNTEASEVNHYNRIGPYFRFETCDRACHVVARSVLNEVNVETVFTKGAR